MGGGYNPCSDSSSDFLVAWYVLFFLGRFFGFKSELVHLFLIVSDSITLPYLG